MFAEQGIVLEVALIKDKSTGQQQGCCFIKYASFEEAERANTLYPQPKNFAGGTAPVQVRYADGERERLGAVEHKLFVGCLNRQASEKEIEEIFSPYGRVDDVYIMKDELKQSRGCAFVKYPSREMATAAINALNGTYIMRGCDQPLAVRYADPKRTKIGDTRVGGPGFGGPGFNPRSVAGPYGPRPSLSPGGPMGSRGPSLGWRPSIGGPGPGVGPRPQGGPSSYPIAPRGGGPGSSASQPTGALGGLPGPVGGPAQGGPAQGLYNSSAQIGGPGQTVGAGQTIGSTTPQQYFQQATQRPQSFGQQLSLQPPQQQLPSASLQPQQQSQGYGQQLSSLQTQPLQQLQQQQQQPPPALQPQVGSHSSQQFQPLQTTLHQHPTLQPLQQQYSQLQPATQQYQVLQVPQQLQQSLPLQQAQQRHQQTPLTVQSLPQQQPLSLQAAYQNQLQPQQLQPQPKLQLQPQSQSQTQPQQQQQVYHQVTPVQQPLQQQSWMLTSQAQPLASSIPLPVASAAPTIAACNWTEHTSPEGHKYYYNSVTGESKWEKPEELTKFEQQQQQQQQQQQISLPQPLSSVSYGAASTPTQHAIQAFTYGQPQLNNGSVDQFRQQIR
ncbi:hypothetical protein O6H91_14G022900 [Diphasiastrum complanatum]|uniref:Uncharacterized protein n=1 Tax=Diphasiastrum complanatum TaxID=34168 RepID=A0ACC2BMF6_DIPCM|nr:hypothetical protein O6H91_14G022900 [Diphasiastrum complanatum]